MAEMHEGFALLLPLLGALLIYALLRNLIWLGERRGPLGRYLLGRLGSAVFRLLAASYVIFAIRYLIPRPEDVVICDVVPCPPELYRALGLPTPPGWWEPLLMLAAGVGALAALVVGERRVHP